ncbi:MAG: site-specific DNA-methyltransferase, partial [Flavobacteriales bacterium]|nr:site-specific DNA-methyltransferase [Flavobacteriales bacterium]
EHRTQNTEHRTQNTESLIDIGFSADALVERKAELLKLLGQTAPDLLSDNQLNLDKLKALLAGDIADAQEHYELSWAGKSAARREIQKTTSSTLLPDPNNPAQAQHMLIEGENLEVLRVLQKSYYGKVKMIYIDPPYNTGNDSFVYPDDYSETLDEYLKRTGEKNEDGFLNKQSLWKKNSKESGQYHSAWLSMMYPRLYLARNLLRDDGVIFISIDDNEQANLKLLCDEVFGVENFVESIVWNKRIPKNDKGIGNIHEYILLYAKNYSLKQEFKMRKDGLDDIYDLVEKLKRKQMDIPDAEKEIKKLYKKNGYDRGITLYNALDENYRLWGKINMSWPNAETFGPDYEVLHPKTKLPVKIPDRGWRWKEDTFNETADRINGEYQNIKELHDGSFVFGRIWFSKDERIQPSSITYLDEVNTFLLRSILSTKSDGGVEVERIFEGKSYFSYPKSTGLLKILFDSINAGAEDIYLDFFAGSGTTAHAVMELNAEDGGNRQSISVQMPELLDEKSEAYKAGYRTIADITRARIEKVIAKLKEEKPEQTEDLACAHFKLAPSNFKVWRSEVANVDAVRNQLEMFQQAEKDSATNAQNDESN